MDLQLSMSSYDNFNSPHYDYWNCNTYWKVAELLREYIGLNAVEVDHFVKYDCFVSSHVCGALGKPHDEFNTICAEYLNMDTKLQNLIDNGHVTCAFWNELFVQTDGITPVQERRHAFNAEFQDAIQGIGKFCELLRDIEIWSHEKQMNASGDAHLDEESLENKVLGNPEKIEKMLSLRFPEAGHAKRAHYLVLARHTNIRVQDFRVDPGNSSSNSLIDKFMMK